MLFIHDFLQDNFPTTVLISFMLMFLFTNTIFDRKTVTKFKVLVFIILVLMISDSVERYQEAMSYPTLLHIFVTSGGYILRISSVMCLISIVSRGRLDKNLFFLLPGFLNCCAALSAFVSDVSYSLSPTNEFIRGPIGYTPHVVGIFYLVFMMAAVWATYKDRKSKENFAVLGIGILTILAIFMETLWGFRNVLTPTIAVEVGVYYLYFQTQKTLRDATTNVLNQYCLENDIAAGYRMKSLVYIDIIGLKKINEAGGKAEGNAAILKVAEGIKAIIPSGARVYRISGADFIVIGMTGDNTEMSTFMLQLKEDMNQKGVPIATGMAIFDEGENFEIVRAKAELDLYRNKQKQKAELNSPT